MRARGRMRHRKRFRTPEDLRHARERIKNEILPFFVRRPYSLWRLETRSGELWIVDLAEAPEEDLAYKVMHARAKSMVQAMEGFDFEPMPLSAAELLPPVTPSKIICVGRNYREHAQELGNEVPAEPLLFFKPPSSLLAPGGVVRMPRCRSAWILKASWRW